MCTSPYQSGWSCAGGESFCGPGGQVTRLAINAHGTPGTLWTGGEPDENVGRDPAKEALAISVRNLPKIAADLKRIYLATAVNSTIFLMGCNAGYTDAGVDLLEALAKVWPQRKIVAFRGVGLQGAEMYRERRNCTEPGMRDTQYPQPTARGSVQEPFGTLWNDLKRMPWASETSGSAIWIENGQVKNNVMEPPFPL
jgi:hypothetical protein